MGHQNSQALWLGSFLLLIFPIFEVKKEKAQHLRVEPSCWRYLFFRVGFCQVVQADTSLTDLSRDGLHPEHNSGNKQKKRDTQMDVSSMLALPIFPGRLQPSIVGRSELNFRVRDGNGWTLALISTNYLLLLTP